MLANATGVPFGDTGVVPRLVAQAVGGVVELAVGSGDSPVEHRSGGSHKREVAALAVALAAVAGVNRQRYRRRFG